MKFRRLQKNGVECDECGSVSKSYATKILNTGQSNTYFRCPECSHTQTVQREPICWDCDGILVRDKRRTSATLLVLYCKTCNYSHLIQRAPKLGDVIAARLRSLIESDDEK